MCAGSSRVSVDAAFYKKLSARENLLYTALLYGQKPGEAERRAMEILEQLGMEKTKFSTPLEEMSRIFSTVHSCWSQEFIIR